MRIHLVRHGQSPGNLLGRVEGQSGGEPLTQLGREQALAAARELRCLILGNQSAPVFASDLPRVSQTAQIVAEVLGTEVWYDDRAREQYYGSMEGRLRAELTPEPTPAGAHINEVGWAGGESVEQLYARVRELLIDLRAWAVDAEVADIVLVTSAGVIQVALCALEQGTLERPHRLVEWRAVANGEVISREMSSLMS